MVNLTTNEKTYTLPMVSLSPSEPAEEVPLLETLLVAACCDVVPEARQLPANTWGSLEYGLDER